MTPTAAALTTPATRPPLPVLPGYRLSHRGEFKRVNAVSPCLPPRSLVALRIGGEFVGAVVLELSQTNGQSWQPVLREGQPVVLAAPGALCAAGLLVGHEQLFARCRCMSLAIGAIAWSISTW